MRSAVRSVPILVWAVFLAVTLNLGVVLWAWADIPDATPSSPDPSHTFYVCVANQPQQYKTWYALDKSLGNCPNGTTEKQLVPAVTP
jgi:hypothetical protein